MKTIREMIVKINNNIEKVENLSFLKSIVDNYDGLERKSKF